MSLRRTFWILALMPLISSIIFAALVLFLYRHERRLASFERSQVDTLHIVQTLKRDWDRLTTTVAIYVATRNRTVRQEVETMINDLRKMPVASQTIQQNLSAIFAETLSSVDYLLRQTTGIEGKAFTSALDEYFKQKHILTQRIDLLVLATAQNYEKTFARNRRLRALSMALFVSTMIFLIGINAFLAARALRLIFGFLYDLKQETEKIKLGSLNAKLEGYQDDPDLGDFIENFNLMAESLQRTFVGYKDMDRFHVLGQLAGGLIHQINNPLAGLLGYIDLLILKSNGNHEIRDLLLTIKRSAERVKQVTNGLFHLTIKANVDFKPLHPVEIIDATVNLLQQEFVFNGVEVDRNYSHCEMMEIHGSASLLQEAFFHIFKNAVDSMPQGGKFKIHLSKPLTSEMIEVICQDSGIGMGPKTLERCFVPFYTTKPLGKALGLGLSIVRTIVARHEGTIEITSRGINQGTTARLTFPLLKRAVTR